MWHTLKIVCMTATLLMLAACSKDAAVAVDQTDKKSVVDENGGGLTLNAEQRDAMGLVTAKLAAVSYRGQLTGYGAVMSFETLAQADADIATAEASATQSAAAAARAKALAAGDDAAVSRETWETASAKAATDQAAVLLAQRKSDVAFGPNAPWHNAAQRTAVLQRLQAGRTALVKVTFPLGTFDAKALNVARVGPDSKRWDATSVWEAPADSSIPGRSEFALVDGSDLAQGERIVATVALGAPQAGVRVPATALILGESDAWIYVKHDASFKRVRLDISHPDGDGYFTTALEPDQEVVTGGAGQLYALEINPSSKSED